MTDSRPIDRSSGGHAGLLLNDVWLKRQEWVDVEYTLVQSVYGIWRTPALEEWLRYDSSGNVRLGKPCKA